MRVFELSTEVKAVRRKKGRTATSAAAYRACCVIECEREGRTHDYTRKRGLEFAEIVLPKGAPAWAADRSKLWNAAEMVERNGKRGKNAGAFKADAQTAREVMFSFPAELSAAGRLKVARIIAQHVVDTYGVAAEFSIHLPGKDGDERNFHCHLLMTTRRLTADGLKTKVREWSDLESGKAQAKELRARIAATMNEALAAEGKADVVRVEHRSFKARGSAQIPTIHQGPAKTHLLRKKQRQEREAWAREAAAQQRDRQAKELAGLKLRQDFALQAKTGELAQRVRAAAAEIKRELAEARRADTGPTGLRRVFLIVTGRAGRVAFDRQARDGQRVVAARARLAALKTELRAERSAFAAGQVRDRAALIERHGREGQQLAQAVRSREGMDRTAESQERRAFAQAVALRREARQPEQQRPPPELGRGLSL